MKTIIVWIKQNRIVTVWVGIGFLLVITYLIIFGNVTWQVLTGFATWMLAAGVFLAFSQITESRRSTNAQVAIELFAILRSKSTKKTLSSMIYEWERDEIVEILQKDEKTGDEIDRLLDEFELLGSLVKLRIVDHVLAIEAFAGPAAVRCWHQLVHYIKSERKRRGFFLQNYEWFTQQAFQHFKENSVKILLNDEDLIHLFLSEDYRYPPGRLDEDINKELKEAEQEKSDDRISED